MVDKKIGPFPTCAVDYEFNEGCWIFLGFVQEKNLDLLKKRIKIISKNLCCNLRISGKIFYHSKIVRSQKK